MKEIAVQSIKKREMEGIIIILIKNVVQIKKDEIHIIFLFK